RRGGVDRVAAFLENHRAGGGAQRFAGDRHPVATVERGLLGSGGPAVRGRSRARRGVVLRVEPRRETHDDRCEQKKDSHDHTALDFHVPRLNSAALAIARSENASVIAQKTPVGPKFRCTAMKYAAGNSNNQKTQKLRYVGVHVSPAPLKD